jgi:iron complex outermembrane receptor protein
MEVMQTTGGDYDVSVRGDNQLQANKLLVMIDGRSIYLDAQGLVVWKLLPVTLPEIKRIEVIKGPASALYGFNAFDGVVNIITKSPEEMKGTTLQFGGGEFGTITSAAVQAGRYEKLGYRLSIGRDQTNQWRDRNALAFRSNKFNVQTEYALSSLSKLSVSGGLVDANRLDSQMVSLALPQGTPQQGYADVLYARPNFFVRGWWQGFSDTTNVLTNPLLASFLRTTDRSFSSITKTRSNSFNGEVQHAVEFGATNRLTYGVNYRTTNLSDNFITTWSREERLGFYLQDEWRATQMLTVVAGVRYDLDTAINPTISPRLALLYKPVPDHTFRTSVSVGYRPPTLVERNLDVRTVIIPFFPFGTQTTNGSSNLAPEEIVSYEAGYQGWYFKHRVRARVDLFFNHISNLINFVGVSPTTSAPVNAADLDIYGGEAGLEFLATQWLTGFANYSYEEIGQSSTSTAPRGAPRFKFNVGLRGEWDNGLSADAALYHVGAATYTVSTAFAAFGVPLDHRVGSYNLLNLRGGYRFWQQQAAAGYMREAEVAVSAFNALNDRHKENPVGDTIGSLVMGWLTLRY